MLVQGEGQPAAASRLEGPDSGLVLELTVVGSPAAHPGSVPLRFVERGGRRWVLAPRDPLPGWARALSSGAWATWRIGREEVSGRAVPVEDPAFLDAEILPSLIGALGEARVTRWFGASYVGFELVPAREDALGSYFDGLATDYDRSVASNWLDRDLRTASSAVLLAAFRPGDRVLEIGCGTGLETLPLAKAGVEIVALDVSEGMLRALLRKAAEANVASRVHGRHLAARDVRRLLDEVGDGYFQGAFSTFGALNCEDGLGDVPSALARLLPPGAPAVFAIWNRTCLVEMAAYALSGRPSRAFARTHASVPVGLSRFGVPVRAYAVRDFVRAFHPQFRVEHVTALPVLLPPYDFAPHLPEGSPLVPLLRALDARLQGRFPFNRLGDHFLVTLRRTEAPAP